MQQEKNKKIYLDHSATTPVDKKVLVTMLPYFSDKFGNPSSVHSFGQEAMTGVDVAREKVAEFLDCSVSEIVFTSGATEADNLAIFGIIKALKRKNPNDKFHIITSSIEHPAVLELFKVLQEQGFEVQFLPVKANGTVDIEDFKQAIKDNTVFVSIMYVNSEVGSIQPIHEIGKWIQKINKLRLKKWQETEPKNRGDKPFAIYFHTDATQAVNFLNCSTKHLHVDLLSLSGHKIYGPKGVGALFVKSDVLIDAIQLGGHHENNRRSGTLNVSGIVGLGEAIKLLDKKTTEKNNKKIDKLRRLLIAGITKNIPNVILNTDLNQSVPSHAHFSFIGAEGEAILISLDLVGVAVSTGSACASSSLQASSVLLAMGINEEVSHSSIRFTLGKNTTETEIKKVITILQPIIKRLRQMSPK
ncbi:MAG: cysteine desulfurase family protein [bacterium]|nr:cysteine desulfurase family protein [bacterium]